MKKIQYLLISISISALSVVAFAQQNQPNGIGDRFFPALGRILTDEQRQSLRDIMMAQSDQFRQLQQQLRSSRQAVLNQIAGGKFDENAVRQYANQSAQAESELTVKFAKALSQMQPPLSAQQVKQLANFQPQPFRNIPDDAGGLPPPHMKLPPPLPRDTNDLPVVQ